MKKQDFDSWEKFSGTYLKASDVDSEKEPYVIIDLTESENDQGKPMIELHLEHNKIRKLFTVNATNQYTLRESGAESPRALVGQTIYFTKVKATNPTTKQQVDALRIKPFKISKDI